ncbi:copper fist DNA binding domain-containing protein [Aspergillus ambiguus]|uniref:putative Cu-dependent DNA-binding protein n=1 Tax=Aspergillus ambiguus TaxID=176160 RepID=UPI003CCDCE7C
MLIDGEKWACEACVRGHRVTTCKHHDRPLIRINRKGRPFSTCSVCHCTPCPTPDEHSKLRRESADYRASNRTPGRASTRPHSSLLPIAPRPTSTSPPSSASSSVAVPSAGTLSASRSRRDSHALTYGADPHARRAPALDPALTAAYPVVSSSSSSAHHGYAGLYGGGGSSRGHGYGHANGHAHGHAGAHLSPQPMYPPSTLDPAQLSLGVPVGGYVSASPVAGSSMAMAERDMFGEAAFVDDAALEALDLDDVLREDWSWLDSGAGPGL